MSTLSPPAGEPTTGGPRGSAAHRDVAEYVAAVRGALDDLPGEVADDLVDGLAADLRELAAESVTPLAHRLGPPDRYAAELRDAAGHGPRGAGRGRARPSLASARTALGDDVATARAALRHQPWWPAASSLATTLRPAWWVVRAWVLLALVVYWVGGRTLGPDDLDLVVLAALVGTVVLSTRVGQGLWSERAWQRRAVLGVNAVAVLAIPAALAWAGPEPQPVPVDYRTVTEQGAPATGLYLDGQPISNLHPYDAQGRPLTGVQLLDDYGRPVQVAEENRIDWSAGTSRPFLPVTDVEGTVRWNVYPLRTATGGVGLRPEASLPALLVPGAPAPGPEVPPAPDAPAPPSEPPLAGPTPAGPTPAGPPPASP